MQETALDAAVMSAEAIDMSSSGDVLAVAVAIIALMVSVLSLIVSVWYQKKSRQVQLSAYVENTVEALRDWSARTIHALSEAVFLCDVDPSRRDGASIFEDRRQLLEKLSALWDEGRFYLPSEIKNVSNKTGGAEKERVRALVLLNDAFMLVRDMNYLDKEVNTALRPKLVECKREFVAELQDLLDSRLRKAMFEEFSDELRRSALRKEKRG